ncbi:MAG: hypothetical protein AAF235_05195 [Planctomycetota bacterium]
MFLDDLSTAGAKPALAATMRFAGQRQRLISHNIANMETPNFQAVDVSPRAFQRQLQRAISGRRESNGGASGRLEFRDTRELRFGASGGLSLTPRTSTGNILGHDRNNRDLERTMQSMVENAGAFRLASDFMRSRGAVINSAIAERVL